MVHLLIAYSRSMLPSFLAGKGPSINDIWQAISMKNVVEGYGSLIKFSKVLFNYYVESWSSFLFLLVVRKWLWANSRVSLNWWEKGHQTQQGVTKYSGKWSNTQCHLMSKYELCSLRQVWVNVSDVCTAMGIICMEIVVRAIAPNGWELYFSVTFYIWHAVCLYLINQRA